VLQVSGTRIVRARGTMLTRLTANVGVRLVRADGQYLNQDDTPRRGECAHDAGHCDTAKEELLDTIAPLVICT
jgi:hypothetical protein